MSKIDVVFIENQGSVSIEIFGIKQLEEARKKAAEMTEYHQQPFTVKVKNVDRVLYPQAEGGQVQ